ncbi:MAG: cyclic nucleotide-binding domain-containing protein [Bdellovibrionales bacterium]|nr:cyclic nucleotide-binding domain-containing protein [Bdellovibrionales bacterium]
MGQNQAVTDSNDEVYSTLAQFPFFFNFGPVLLAQLAEIAVYRVVAKGDYLLTQGQLNSNLYILLNGRLGVLVDGARIANLNTPGDLVGEMSVISLRPCSATILADTDAELYVVRADELKERRGPDEDRIQLLLYRIYSQVLADKLELTNQKAKRIEEINKQLETTQELLHKANRDLEIKVEDRTKALQLKTQDLMEINNKLEARNEEVTISHKKLEEIYASRASTLSQLQKLYKDHLIPLRFSLDSLVMTGDETTRRITQEARTEILQAIELLEPISSLYLNELSLKTKKILLADSVRKHQINAKMALGGTGIHLDIAANPQEMIQSLEKNYDVIFVDTAMLPLLEMALEKNPQVKVVLMTSEKIAEYLPRLLVMPTLPNVVTRRDEDRTFTIKNIVTAVTKLMSQDIFGLEKYLNWGTEVKEFAVTGSQIRPSLLAAMDGYFESLGVRRVSRDRMKLVAEELLMNAIYDAPVDKNRKSLFNHLSRTVEVHLSSDQYSRLRYATDGMFCAVSVEDPFGALNGPTILKYLERCYGLKNSEPEAHKGGAGRGLHQIVENSDLVVFNLHNQRRTEVVALFNVDIKAEKGESIFHLFIK